MVCRLPYFAARLLKYAVVAAVLDELLHREHDLTVRVHVGARVEVIDPRRRRDRASVWTWIASAISSLASFSQIIFADTDGFFPACGYVTDAGWALSVAGVDDDDELPPQAPSMRTAARLTATRR